MEKLVNKQVNLDLTTVESSNAFALMGAFSKACRRSGNWEQNEIDLVLEQCKEGDYDHLVSVLLLYCEPEEDE